MEAASSGPNPNPNRTDMPQAIMQGPCPYLLVTSGGQGPLGMVGMGEQQGGNGKLLNQRIEGGRGKLTVSSTKNRICE